MSVTITPLGEHAGAEVGGLDLRRPVDDETRKRLNRALADHVALVFRDQDLTPKQFADAGRLFGTPMKQLLAQYHLPDCPEVGVVSNRDRDAAGDGKILIRGTTWHTDHSNKEIPPKATALYSVSLPDTGGDTKFTNTAAAYDALPEATKKRIDGLKAVHAYLSSRTPRKLPKRTGSEAKESPPVEQPLVRTHPENGRKALYLNPVRIEEIAGMEKEAAFALLDELMTHATEERFQYRHKWRLGDMVIWDDRCSMHEAETDYDMSQLRLLHRLMIEGTRPV
jgi:taurine dioxygenase